MASYRLPDGRVILDGEAFVYGDIQYPGNWVALSTSEERQALGLVGPLPPPAWHDPRLYQGLDDEGQPIARDQAVAVALLSEAIRRTARELLQPSDWTVIREAETGLAAPSALKAWRQQVRECASAKLEAVAAAPDIKALAVFLSSPDYEDWPPSP